MLIYVRVQHLPSTSFEGFAGPTFITRGHLTAGGVSGRMLGPSGPRRVWAAWGGR